MHHSMAFRWRANDDRLFAVFGFSLPSSTKKYEQINAGKEQCMLHISVLKIIVAFGRAHEMCWQLSHIRNGISSLSTSVVC